jgi:UDP-glucose 4-epimerase
MISKNILITGGMGYIGSHTAVVLLSQGFDIVIFDNLSNSSIQVKDQLEKISSKKVTFVKGDVLDIDNLQKTVNDFNIDTVFHFAGLKAVGESVKNPNIYFENNISGSINLLKAMKLADVKKIIFSSSATVYGEPLYLPYDEDHPTNATNPYGRSKLHIEEMLKDVCNSDKDFSAICLRYFNPVGAHESALIGENPKDIPNNLMPFITQVASNKLTKLNIFGNDYNTPDGTGVRDYIHIMDLVEGHVKAMSYIENNKGWHAINLGTGKGISVLEMVKSFERVNSVCIPYQFLPRRKGDIDMFYSNIKNSKNLLNWKAKRGVEEMCKSSWDFQKKDKLK